MTLHFTKMHGLGNDFVIINAINEKVNLENFHWSQLANHHTGIGFDQLLIVDHSKQADFFCRIYNADGSEAEQCGNGLRCVARYIHEQGMHKDKQFKIETRAGIFTMEIQDYDHIRVCMGRLHGKNEMVQFELTHPTQMISLNILSLGNPHAITKMNSIDNIPLEQLATQISAHDMFPEGVNVGFMQIIDKNHIRLRTYERGVGETLACGSNACAAAMTGITQGWLHNQVKVEFNYGSLMIEWEGENKPVYMTGPATKVYQGELFM